MDKAWNQVDELINTRRPAVYDVAVALLTDLKAVYERSGTPATFTNRYQLLRTDHQRKPSLITRLNQAQL